MTQHISWQKGSWTTEPKSSSETDSHLVVEALKGSDYWQKTMYEFQHDNGHALLIPWDTGQAMEVTFMFEGFSELYDQAGIMLWHSPNQWIKAGIEVTDGVPHIGAVVTDEFSDWSTFPLPANWSEKKVTIRASVYKDAVIIRARAQDSHWHTIRVARFPYSEGNHAGPFLCAPTSDAFKVTFTNWVINDPDEDIHTDPPITEN
ncbi:DUF1349 domain-containing protein [Paenibacillus piscarius]|uniref:DUF1349 domain-containing protein n=1 Tax=Paenibacillus piscarius TaxID=1089681 RepID=UPI001EE9853A|nr:DUF1349 domain-containing protein [Paenibacillus piscarius]